MRRAATIVGSSPSLFINVALLIASGVLREFSEEWWKWGDRYVTFIGLPLMIVFQASQNIDTLALHRKIDELIRALPTADNRYMHLEDKNPQQ